MKILYLNNHLYDFFWSFLIIDIFNNPKILCPRCLKDNKDKNYYSLTLINIFHALVMGLNH